MPPAPAPPIMFTFKPFCPATCVTLATFTPSVMDAGIGSAPPEYPTLVGVAPVFNTCVVVSHDPD